MRLEDLKSWLDAHEEWDYQPDEKGLLVRNERVETVTHLSFDAVEKNTLETLTVACLQSKDVDHITRVTGYFSRTSGWNKGKTAELRDRHRSTV
jgi:hypothetical protein